MLCFLWWTKWSTVWNICSFIMNESSAYIWHFAFIVGKYMGLNYIKRFHPHRIHFFNYLKLYTSWQHWHVKYKPIQIGNRLKNNLLLFSYREYVQQLYLIINFLYLNGIYILLFIVFVFTSTSTKTICNIDFQFQQSENYKLKLKQNNGLTKWK